MSLSYLSDWLEIPRASLHVTLGPRPPGFTGSPDPSYLTLDGHHWLPTTLIHLLFYFSLTLMEPLLLLYTLSLLR